MFEQDDIASRIVAWRHSVSRAAQSNMEMIDIMPDVDESGREARTWCWKRQKDQEGTSSRESVSVLYWELQDDTWICVKMMSLQGSVGF